VTGHTHGGSNTGGGSGGCAVCIPSTPDVVTCSTGGQICVNGEQIHVFRFLDLTLNRYAMDAVQYTEDTALVRVITDSSAEVKTSVLRPTIAMIRSGQPTKNLNERGENILTPYISENVGVYVKFIEAVLPFIDIAQLNVAAVQRFSDK
jgi:hypothetical protein